MKKLIYCAAALSMAFFAASCQQEALEPVAQESAVTFSVELPGVQTKAIGDGFNVDQLVYEVWKTEEPNERDLTGTANGKPKATRLYQDKAVMATKDGEQKTVISLNLVHDQNYTVLFWAQKEGTGVYNTDQLTNVHYAKELNGGSDGYFSNQENYAAFYQTEFLTAAEIEKPGMRRTELVRPFAQLNIGTKNTSEDYDVEVLSSKVIVSNVGTCFNVAQNYVADPEKGRNQPQIAVGGAATVTFDTATDPSGEDEYIIVNNQKYEYVAMNYLFATGNNVTVSYEINTKLTATNSSTTDAKVSNTVINVPLQENYRTNIIGNLLTSSTEYEVVIDATWDDVNDENLNGDGYVVEVWDGKYAQEPPMVDGVYQISLASELAWLSAAVNGTLIETKSTVGYKDAQPFTGVTFKLMEDIDLLGDKGARWIPIGAAGKPFKGTFDGNGKTISNLTVATEGKASAGLFGATTSATINNVTVVNANITGHYKTGVIVGDGLCAKIENCHVDGATVISTPWKNEKGEWDDANNVGGIVGYLSAEQTAYVKNCSVKDATITAYRKVGGIVGAANGPAEVSGKTLGTVKVTADMTQEYKSVETAYAGPYVGYKHNDAKVTILENSVTPEVNVLMDSAAELNAGSGNDEIAHVFISEGEIDFEADQDVKVNGSIQTNPYETVVLNVAGNTITTGATAHYGFIASEGSTLEINEAEVESLGGGIAAIDGANVTFNDGSLNVNSTNTSGRYNFYVVGEDTEVTINGGEFSFDPKKNQKRAYIYCGAGATVYVNGGTFGKASTRSGYTAGILGEGTVIITGGTFGFDPTQWVSAGYTAKKNEETQTWEVVSLKDPENLKNAVSVPDATVKMAAGEYTFPSSSIAEGVTIECEEGTVFTGTSSLNINGATVIGATFSNPSGSAVGQTVNGTFKNCTFDGSNALRYCYAGETTVFENCVFSGDVYGVHFDGGENDLYFKNCTFSGFNAFGRACTLLTLEDCTFKSNGRSGYNGANLWGSTEMINTEFKFDGTASNEWVDCIGVDKTYEFTRCTINGGSALNPEYLLSRNPNTKIKIDNVTYTWTKGGYLVDEDGTAVVSNNAALKSAVAAEHAVISLIPGNYEVELYNIKERESLTITGSEGTKVAFNNLQVRASQFKYFTIENCEILRMPDKSWGHLVFGASTKADGVYTISKCTFNGVGSQGIYINETASGATYNILNCTFNGDFGREGAVTIQNNGDVKHTVNVTDCTFNNIPETSHEIYVIYAYAGWDLNTTADVYWKELQ